MDDYQLLAFDPGGRTGWAVFCIAGEAMHHPEYLIMANIQYWNAGEFWGPLDEQVDQMVELANEWDDAEIVNEDFVLKQFLPAREVLDPVRINAAFQHAIRPRTVNYIMPAQGVGQVTDERLKLMGLYHHHLLVGKKDARQAVQTGLAYARQRREFNMKVARLNGTRPKGVR